MGYPQSRFILFQTMEQNCASGLEVTGFVRRWGLNRVLRKANMVCRLYHKRCLGCHSAVKFSNQLFFECPAYSEFWRSCLNSQVVGYNFCIA